MALLKTKMGGGERKTNMDENLRGLLLEKLPLFWATLAMVVVFINLKRMSVNRFYMLVWSVTAGLFAYLFTAGCLKILL